EGDIRKREDWVKALKENEVVVHLADYHDYLPSFSKLFHINAVGTAILFELLLEGKTSVRRIVLGSTTAVYGEGKYRCGKDGDVYPLPRRVDVLERGVWDPPCPICGGAIQPGGHHRIAARRLQRGHRPRPRGDRPRAHPSAHRRARPRPGDAGPLPRGGSATCRSRRQPAEG